MGKYLVTGATGFTGGRMARLLLAKGHRVVAFVRSLEKAKNLTGLGIECREVDLKSRESVADNFADIERVFHIAAAYRTEHADRSEFFQVNVEGTRNLLEAAKAHGVKRFVHTSTVGVQGRIDDPPADEEYRFLPSDHYQQSKLEGELLAREYFKEGLPGAVVRPVGIYGPGDTRFLKLFKPINKGVFVMIGSGKILYHMTFVEDLCQGFYLAGTHENAKGQVFTIGGPEYTTLRELVNRIADILDKPRPKLRVPFGPVWVAAWLCETLCRPLKISPPLYPRRMEFFQHSRAFSIEKARRFLGYEPKYGLREGLAKTAEWYKREGLI